MESSTCSCISRAINDPVSSRRRSESVDFPWSIWAMIAKLRMCLRSIWCEQERGANLYSNRHCFRPTSRHTLLFARPPSIYPVPLLQGALDATLCLRLADCDFDPLRGAEQPLPDTERVCKG